jgi:hypothetical protein
MLNRPNIGLPRRSSDQQSETPLISVQRPTPPFQPTSEPPSDVDSEDAPVTIASKNTARPPATPASTLETVQEVSPIGSPQNGDESVDERLQDSVNLSEVSQTDSFVIGPTRNSSGRTSANDSGSETDNTRIRRQSSVVSTTHLAVRPSSTFKQSKNKEFQSMTVETETVTSIPQAPLIPGAGPQGSGASLRTKASTETIRPKKEKRKPSRRQHTVAAGNGELTPTSPGFAAFFPRLRHFPSMGSVVPSFDSRAVSPTKRHHHHHHHHHFHYSSSDDASASADGCHRGSSGRRQSLAVSSVGSLLTRHRTASSKADIFEAKVASAVEEAEDSDETFVYDSNPPDGRDRPLRFHHSRTPSTTSMASQNLDRAGLRSIHSVMESALPPVPVKKNMKFVNTSITNGNSDGAYPDDDGRGTGRSGAGSARGTSRHQHHHFGRWGRNGNSNGGNGHPSLFAEQSPFGGSMAANNVGSRQSSQPPSPRYPHGHRFGKRSTHLAAGYDFDDTTTGADDERTPLISGTIRSGRSGRNRRNMTSLRSLEAQAYRNSTPSVLNRFASCLVLTVMILLVVSGAIGFMFATSQPLTDIQLVAMDHVVASQQELMLDLTVKAHNPNVVVVVIDSADIEVFAKSPHAMSDTDWWYHTHPGEMGPPPPKKIDPQQKNEQSQRGLRTTDANPDPDPDPTAPDDSAPNMRLGTITGFESALSFEGSFFHKGISYSSGEVRLKNPGNGTYGGPERWERIMEDEFTLILKGVLKYTLPLSQRVRTATISGKTTVKPNAANDPPADPPANGTVGVNAEKMRKVEDV